MSSHLRCRDAAYFGMISLTPDRAAAVEPLWDQPLGSVDYTVNTNSCQTSCLNSEMSCNIYWLQPNPENKIRVMKSYSKGASVTHLQYCVFICVLIGFNNMIWCVYETVKWELKKKRKKDQNKDIPVRFTDSSSVVYPLFFTRKIMRG